MCVIETRTLVYSNGTRYTNEYPQLCSRSDGKNPCRHTQHEVSERFIEVVPPLSPNAPSPMTYSCPPTPPTYANVEFREPSSSLERRDSKKEKEYRRRYIKPEFVIQVGSSSKATDREKKYHRRSNGSVGTSASSDIIFVESPTTKRHSPVVVVGQPPIPPPPPSPRHSGQPFYAGRDLHSIPTNPNIQIVHPAEASQSSYNTTYAYPPPPPPPPAPRPHATRDVSPSSPDTRRKSRKTPITLHQDPNNSPPRDAVPVIREPPPRARRVSISTVPITINDNEFELRQAERERLRDENRRKEEERRQRAEDANQARLEAERAAAREQSRREDREKRERRRQEELVKERQEAEAAAAAAEKERKRERRQSAQDARRQFDRAEDRDRQRKDNERRRRQENEEEEAAAERAADKAARDAARDNSFAAREKNQQRRLREEDRRRRERVAALDRERALGETTQQMALEREAALRREANEFSRGADVLDQEADREYWSPRTGLQHANAPRPLLRNESRHLGATVAGGPAIPPPPPPAPAPVPAATTGGVPGFIPGRPRRSNSVRYPATAAAPVHVATGGLPGARGETSHERGERIIAQSRALAHNAQTRAQERTREMVDRFGTMRVGPAAASSRYHDLDLDDDEEAGSGGRAFGGVLHSRRRAASRGAHDGGYYSDVDGGMRGKRRSGYAP